MKTLLSSLLLLSLLSATAFAASTSSLPVTSSDDYFERAQKKAEQLKLMFDESVKLETSGKLDKATLPEELKEGRRQKLSATPDLSGTVLPYVLFRTQR